MTATAANSRSVEQFLDLAVRSDGPAAVRHVLQLLDDGATTETVIVDVLAAAQWESGERWLRNEWSVAHEHIVSGITQRTLDAIANSIEPRATAGSVVIACAEGDWHSLPSQMFGEILRSRGYHVAFLGATTPADHLVRFLSRNRPDALVVTCNLALFFGGVTRLADAAHHAGVPVIVGGRTMNDRRAERLGVDAWAPDVETAIDIFHNLAGRPPKPAAPNGASIPAGLLDAESAALAASAVDVMSRCHPPTRKLSPSQLDRTREDLASIVRFTAAARLVDDRSVLTEFLDWLCVLLAARGVPSSALVAGVQAIAPGVESLDDRAGSLLGLGLKHISERRDQEGHAESLGHD